MSYSLPSLSHNTFVEDWISAFKPRTVFFLTFAKQELLTETHQLCLNEAMVFKQHLFELFLFLTKYTGGSVYQIMLEPVVLPEQEEKLNPYLRYEMSTGVLFLFVLPRCKSLETLPFDVQLANAKQQQIIAAAEKSELPHLQNAAAKVEKAFNSAAVTNNTIEYGLNEDQTLGNAKHTLVKAIKKLICYNMGLSSMEGLMLKGTGETLFPHINFATNYFKHTGASALPTRTSFRQPVEHNFSFPQNFGVRYITEIAWRYFIYRDDCLAEEYAAIHNCDVDDDPSPGTCELCLARTLWRFHVSNMNGCQILHAFRRSTAEGALTRLLDELADCEPDSMSFELRGGNQILIFKLEPTDLFPSKYRNVELPCFRPFTDDELSSFSVLQRENLQDCVYKTWCELTASTPRKCAIDETVLRDSFRINFPHLATIRDILKAFDSDFSNPAAHHLLLYTLLNHQHIKGTPRQFHNYLKIMLSKVHDSSYVASMCMRVSTPLIATFGQCPLKTSYKSFMETVFVRHFGISRMPHAITAYHYVMCNAAPRWRCSRLMLLNCTKPGEGKTFTNSLLRTLFKNTHLLEILGSMSPASLKYTTVPNMMKTLILDDVGLSEGSLKNAKNESSMIASSFKNILDTGCVVSITADKQEANKSVKSRHVSTAYLAVYNTGFIWNTNSMNIFTSAMIDRSIIFDTVGGHNKSFEEAMIQYYSTEENSMQMVCENNSLIKVTEMALMRSYIFQVTTSMLYPEAFRPIPQHDMLIMSACCLYHTQFATMRTSESGASSKARSMDAIRDLAFQKTCFLATMYVYDLWIPPWTERSRDPKEMGRNRMEALSRLGWPELNLECIMAFQLIYPSCLLEAIPIILGQESVMPLKLLKQILTACIAQNCSSTVVFEMADNVVVLNFNEDLNIAIKINSDVGQKILVSLQDVRVPVAYGNKLQLNLVQELKTIRAPGKRPSFRLTICGEVLLSVIFVFFEDSFNALYEKIIRHVVNFAEVPMRVLLKDLELTPTELFIVHTMTLCPRLGVKHVPQLGLLLMGRATGLRVYNMRDELKRKQHSLEVNEMQTVYLPEWIVRYGPDDSSEAEDAIFDIPQVYEHGNICVSLLNGTFKLVRFTDKEYCRYVFAPEYCTFTRSLTLFDGSTLITSSEGTMKPMHPVHLPPTQKITKLHELMTMVKEKDGRYVLKKEWEYVVAARTNYLFKHKCEPADENELFELAECLKREKYAHNFSTYMGHEASPWAYRTQESWEHSKMKYYGGEVSPIDVTILQLNPNDMILNLHDSEQHQSSRSYESGNVYLPPKEKEHRKRPAKRKNSEPRLSKVSRLLNTITE